MDLSQQYFNIQSAGGFKTRKVVIGELEIGADNPVAVQSMTTTNTQDVENTVAQSKRIFDAGGQLVRITTPAARDANLLKDIKQALEADGYLLPLAADVHYNANVAELAAAYVEKVRINPGNYVDKNSPDKLDYSEEEYLEELSKIENRIRPLIQVCKKNNTCIRIGTNHGSLSNRIVSKYGDTPLGMVESTMEFLRIFKKEEFHNLVISLKSSNTRVMVYASRMLVAQMQSEGLDYPIHLGVTEAGDGEDGRLKSAIGIGTLLADGIGDTIRVSLTEEPEFEIPVAKKIVAKFAQAKKGLAAHIVNPFDYERRITRVVQNIGGKNVPVVLSYVSSENKDLQPDYCMNIEDGSHESLLENNPANNTLNFVEVDAHDISGKLIKEIEKDETAVLVLSSENENWLNSIRQAILSALKESTIPVLVKHEYDESDLEQLQVMVACDYGPLLIDGLIDGVFISNSNSAISNDEVLSISFGVLQASRSRITKPDYISCPGCGRTLFDLHKTTASIKQVTSHLKGVKIGIMGCIVNGPGEMADADFGYVGSGPGRVSLYREKQMVKKNIPEKDAVRELVQLIKDAGSWVDNLD